MTKRIIGLILSFALLINVLFSLGINVYADELTTGKCGENVTYSFDSTTGTLTISGTGNMSGYSFSGSPFFYNKSIIKIIINSGVTSIGNYAFGYCLALTSITIPDSVTSIGEYAFEYCRCLTSVTIPNGVTSIGSGAFYNCTVLTSITLGNGLTSIGSGAFYNCTGLTSIIVDSKNPYYNSKNNCNAVIKTSTEELIVGCKTTVIPDSVTSIGKCAFRYCTGLTSITIPSSVTNIGGGAFESCTALVDVYYKSCEHNWEKISIDSYNSCLTDANIHYSYSYDNGKVTTNPTCAKTGVKTYTCTVCGATKAETISATGAHKYNNGVITTQPSCTNTGVKTYTCIDCNYKKTEIINSLGHNYKGDISIAPTCLNDGLCTYTCSRCGHSYTKVIEKLGHNYIKTVTKATPKKNGKIVTKCSRCSVGSTKTIAAPRYVYLSAYTYEYNGKVKTPKVEVFDGNDELVKPSNYSVTYSKGRKKLGTYTVTVKFKGNYSGTSKKTFTITPKRVKMKTIKVKAASTEEIEVSWAKVKGVDGYEVYRLSNKDNEYKLYKNTTKNSIKIKRDSKKYNDVHFAIKTYKKVGKKTYRSYYTYEYGWVKLSAPSFTVEQEDFNEFTLHFSYKDFYDVQVSNNKDFSNSDSDRTKNKWTKSYRQSCKHLTLYNAKTNEKYYIRARKYYYNKNEKLVVGPWSKVKTVRAY
ncbi:MAG: leucine-rich repeat domain-containing protein [Eubacterium sp.]|nr:leucine-rich repeat domain-containing protein [Eubacterium sp.]